MSLSCSYSVTGFLDKNKDNLYQDFKRLLYNRYLKLVLIQNLCLKVDCFSIFLSLFVRQYNEIVRMRNKILITLGMIDVKFDCVCIVSLCRSSHKILKEMWPEGKDDITKVI